MLSILQGKYTEHKIGRHENVQQLIVESKTQGHIKAQPINAMGYYVKLG